MSGVFTVIKKCIVSIPIIILDEICQKLPLRLMIRGKFLVKNVL